MSELEIQRRQEYKRNRKKWSLIQTTAIIVLMAIALGSFLIYQRIDETQYIEYSQSSNIDYKVQYKENEFFDSEWIEKNQSYISSLINALSADFSYKMNVDSDSMSFNYTYWIDAKLLIASKENNTPYYTVEDIILPKNSMSSNTASSIKIDETVSIDFVKYNDIAKTFIKTYNLQNATSTLIVTLNVESCCSNQKFNGDCQNTYSTSLNIPLALDTFSVHSTSSAPANSTGSFEYHGVANRNLFRTVSIASIVLAALLIVSLFTFLHLTKNDDITYAAKVRKILASYGSFIQRIDGEFDSEGYQIVMIKTFVEMLGIRDTIQSPVLMWENKDETMTQFFIPTNTKILYVFEIKVDNFDEIYGNIKETEEIEEIEEPVILVNVNEEELAEAMAQPDINLSEIEFVPDDDDQFEVSPEEPGIEVVGVVWPEKAKQNKVYRYDPNGEILNEGDIVLVPTMDHSKGREVIRKVAVAHGNHRVDPSHFKHPLKKIIAIIKRSISHSLTPTANENMNDQIGAGNKV